VHSLCSTAVPQDVSYWKFYLFAGSCFEEHSQFVSFSEMWKTTMQVIYIFTMQQRQQQCSFSQASRNAVQAIPKQVIFILQVQIQ